jgi:large subunit ribosomal protein L10
MKAKTFYFFQDKLRRNDNFRKEVQSLALTKEKKQELVEQYGEWLEGSNAIVFTEYTGLNMLQMDELRMKAREVGAEFHVVKNRLGKRVFDAAGYEFPPDLFTGSTAIGIGFEDAPGIAKVIKDFGKDQPALQIKGGVMYGRILSAAEVTALADLPPLPVVRGQLLGVISAPASKLARILAEPGRSLAQVIKAHADAAAA